MQGIVDVQVAVAAKVVTTLSTSMPSASLVALAYGGSSPISTGGTDPIGNRLSRFRYHLEVTPEAVWRDVGCFAQLFVRDDTVLSDGKQEPETGQASALRRAASSQVTDLRARCGLLTTIRLHTSQSVGTSQSLLPHLGQRYPPFFINP